MSRQLLQNIFMIIKVIFLLELNFSRQYSPIFIFKMLIKEKANIHKFQTFITTYFHAYWISLY